VRSNTSPPPVAGPASPNALADVLMTRRRATWWMCSAMAAFGTALSGCAAYRFGAASLYPPDIQTVYVPVFESNSFRRSLSEWLTEAVCKEIELKTPYKVVGTPQADSVLTGKLTTDTKRVIVEDRYDQPREVEVNMSVQVRWVNRRGDLLNSTTSVPLPQDLLTISAPGMLVPEYGQSVSTAQLQSIQRLATQIVSLMEMPW
jgi:Lipopolysaccharide-assembly